MTRSAVLACAKHLFSFESNSSELHRYSIAYFVDDQRSALADQSPSRTIYRCGGTPAGV